MTHAGQLAVDVAVIGGGFAGTMVCIRLAERGVRPLAICLFEPRNTIGGGIAYSTTDPDHRLNGSNDLVDFWGHDHFAAWYAQNGNDAEDMSGEHRFARRHVIAGYVGRAFERLAGQNDLRMVHLRHEVSDVTRASEGFAVHDTFGGKVRARHVVLATGHLPPRLPGPFAALAGTDLKIVADPWAPGALASVARTEDVLILGTGLTAFDVAASLLRRGHSGRITLVSRSGRLPQGQGRLERMQPGWVSPLAPFTSRHCPPYTALGLLRAVRADLAQLERQGHEWHLAVDNLRMALPDIWSSLTLTEQRRCLRHLAGLYSSYRFRIAPQTDTIVRQAAAAGQVHFRRGRAGSMTLMSPGYSAAFASGTDRFSVAFDALINCTGPVQDMSAATSPLIRSLLAQGLVRPNPNGIGLDIDGDMTAIGATGRPTPDLSVAGATTSGHFGDTVSMPQIDAQVCRIAERLTKQAQPCR